VEDLDHISEEELASLNAVQSEDEWCAACVKIKDARGNKYPNDWYEKVLKSGMMDRIAAQWGGDSKIHISSR